MFARRKTFWCKRMMVWQFLFCLTVVSFLCRAFIPVGYMPDLSGERDSTFAITLCSMGGGTTVMQMDLSADSGKVVPDESYSGENCPFGLNVAHKLMPGHDTPVLAGTTAFHPFAPPSGNQALPPLPALGPPLGSRAPPLNLG